MLVEAEQIISTYSNADSYRYQCNAWLMAAQNSVCWIVKDPNNAYRIRIDEICDLYISSNNYSSVMEAKEILRQLWQDIDAGLMASIEDRARAIVYDDFLDHAKAYFHDNKKKEAGVIAGVVFEDTIRTICRSSGIGEKDRKLDSLIDALAKIEVITQVKAKKQRLLPLYAQRQHMPNGMSLIWMMSKRRSSLLRSL